MRNAAIVLALSALPALSFAAPVKVKRPHVLYWPNPGVTAACKTSAAACTKIAADFYCGCELHKTEWTLAPTIIAQPTIYATSDAYIIHELEHIADVRDSLSEYAASLLMRSFPSGASCLEFVADEAKAFPSTMKSIERATTIRRDGLRFAGPAE